MSQDLKRNDPCSCNSGRKYKRCCLGKPFYLYPKQEFPEKKGSKNSLGMFTMLALSCGKDEEIFK